MIRFQFHTIHNGTVRTYTILGTSGAAAAATLRSGLYDGETIIGWD